MSTTLPRQRQSSRDGGKTGYAGENCGKGKSSGIHSLLSPNPKVTRLQDNAMDKFHLSDKKVERPMFSSEDLAGRIARAEVYFRSKILVQKLRSTWHSFLLMVQPLTFSKL